MSFLIFTRAQPRRCQRNIPDIPRQHTDVTFYKWISQRFSTTTSQPNTDGTRFSLFRQLFYLHSCHTPVRKLVLLFHWCYCWIISHRRLHFHKRTITWNCCCLLSILVVFYNNVAATHTSHDHINNDASDFDGKITGRTENFSTSHITIPVSCISSTFFIAWLCLLSSGFACLFFASCQTF